MKYKIPLNATLEADAWMNIANPALTVEEAVEKLKSLGNKILEVDKNLRRVKVMQEKVEYKNVYKCDFCNFFHPDLDATLEHEKLCSQKS